MTKITIDTARNSPLYTAIITAMMTALKNTGVVRKDKVLRSLGYEAFSPNWTWIRMMINQAMDVELLSLKKPFFSASHSKLDETTSPWKYLGWKDGEDIAGYGLSSTLRNFASARELARQKTFKSLGKTHDNGLEKNIRLGMGDERDFVGPKLTFQNSKLVSFPSIKIEPRKF